MGSAVNSKNQALRWPIAFHNVAECAAMTDGGLRFQRVPEAVRCQLNEHARERMLDAVGSEVRFVMHDEQATVRLHTTGTQTQVVIFFGDIPTDQPAQIGPELTELRIRKPRWLLEIDPARLAPVAFDPRVCRVVLYRGTVCFHGVDGAIEPPSAGQLPPLGYLAYGTSITQGASAARRHLSYVPQTAWRLGADAINLGSASSAFCEPAMADHIAERCDWHVATLALSTNMSGFNLDVFRERVDYMVRRVAGADPKRAVACITLWPKAADLGPDHCGRGHAAAPEAYREVLREVVHGCGMPNVHLLEGPDLLPHWRGLGPDLLHPHEYGHSLIAANLAPRLEHLLALHNLPRPIPPMPADPKMAP